MADQTSCFKGMVVFAFILSQLFLWLGCATAPSKPPETVPLTEEEIAFLKRLEDPEVASVKEDIPKLFFRLNQLIKSWEDSSLYKRTERHLRIYSNIGAMLTRRVYFNFEKILDQLENGSQPNRVIAAMALGFSRIPENDRFPQVYPQAIPALLRALEIGDDDITKNTLLSLKILADPATPIEPILPLMTQHHDPDVRSNAALCLAAIVEPHQCDLVTPYVLPSLKDDHPQVRLHAINIILKLGDKSAAVPLIDLMEDRYELIRANTARALGELGDPTACGALIANLDHPKEIVRIYCLNSLKNLSGEDYGQDTEKWSEWWREFRRSRAEGLPNP